MKRLFPFKIKKVYLLSITSLFVIIVTVILVSNKNSGGVASTPVPSNFPTPIPKPASGEWGTMEELSKEFGTPKAKETSPERTEEYSINGYVATNSIIYKDGVPVFGKEIITPKSPKTAASIQSKFGSSEVILYADAGYLVLYAYPTKGIAYVGAGTTPILFEIWYFEPTNLSTFRSTWAIEYSDTPPTAGF